MQKSISLNFVCRRTDRAKHVLGKAADFCALQILYARYIFVYVCMR